MSKGAQYILWRAQVHEKLADALADVDLAVAFTRWLPGQSHPALPDIPSLLGHPVVQQMLQQPQRAIEHNSNQQQGLQDVQQQPEVQVQRQQQQKRARIALVFGREEFGLSDDEVAACDIACAISIGRLQVGCSSLRAQQAEPVIDAALSQDLHSQKAVQLQLLSEKRAAGQSGSAKLPDCKHSHLLRVASDVACRACGAACCVYSFALPVLPVVSDQSLASGMLPAVLRHQCACIAWCLPLYCAGNFAGCRSR